jgi:hypothetical protein
MRSPVDIGPDPLLQGTISPDPAPRIVVPERRARQSRQKETLKTLGVVNQLSQHFVGVKDCRGCESKPTPCVTTSPAELPEIESDKDSLAAAHP